MALQSTKNQRSVQVDTLFAKVKRKFFSFRRLSSDSGSASVEFVLLAIPLFLPILIFVNQFASLSNSELVARTLVRESLRAYVTSENPLVASSRANQVLVEGAKIAGLKQEEIRNLKLNFECSEFPCISPGGKIRAILSLRLPNQNREVRAEAEEYISPWQWNGLGTPVNPSIKVDL